MLITDATSDGIVEDKGSGAGHLEGSAIVAGVELVADVRVLVVENAVGTRTPWINAGLRLLLEFPVFAIDVVRQDTLLAVADGVIEEEAVGAEVGLGHAVLTDVVKVALLRIGKETVLFRTSK